jgi:hypothetical protein
MGGIYNKNTEKFNAGCSCLSGLCVYENGDIIGDKFPKDHYISDYINLSNIGIKGDKCDFFLTNVLKSFPFPILEGEKFIAESVVWNRMALYHKTLYINIPFARKYYLQDGLSSQPLFHMNPRSAELYYNEATIPQFSLKLQIKNSSQYIYFAKFNKEMNAFGLAKNKKIFPLGLFVYWVQKLKQRVKKVSLIYQTFRLIKRKFAGPDTGTKIFTGKR